MQTVPPRSLNEHYRIEREHAKDHKTLHETVEATPVAEEPAPFFSAIFRGENDGSRRTRGAYTVISFIFPNRQ
jgi:hypothetical protein